MGSEEEQNDTISGDTISFVAHVYVMPVLLFIGLVGQLLNVVTLNQPSLRGISFLYLRAIAVADILSILFLIPFVVRHAGKHLTTSYAAMFYHAHFEVTIVNSFLGASSFCIVGLTVERYLSITRPTWSRNGRMSSACMRNVIVVLYAASFVVHLPSCWQKRVVHKPDVGGLAEYDIQWNELNESIHFRIYLIMRELIVRLVPILVLVVVNVLIVRAFRTIARNHRRLTRSDIRTNHSGTDSPNTTKHRGSVTSQQQRDVYDAESRVYVLIVITVATFIVNTLPASILTLVVAEHLNISIVFQIFRATANLLQVTSYVLNFYIYCLCSTEYRDAFRRLVTCTEWRSRRKKLLASRNAYHEHKQQLLKRNNNNNNNNHLSKSPALHDTLRHNGFAQSNNLLQVESQPLLTTPVVTTQTSPINTNLLNVKPTAKTIKLDESHGSDQIKEHSETSYKIWIHPV